MMRVLRTLGIFGVCLFVGLGIFDFATGRGWLPFLGGAVGQFVTFMLPSLGLPLGRDFSIPLLIALLAASLSMAFGMWRVAKTGPQLIGLIFGLLLICVVVPILALAVVLVAFFTP
jgi:hypothetical protein